MNKKRTLTIEKFKRTSTRLAEWQERSDDTERFTQFDPPDFFSLGGSDWGSDLPCDGCLPEMPPVVLNSSGDLVDGEGNVVGSVDDDGNIEADESATGNIRIKTTASGVSGSLELPTNGINVNDVWFDFLRATPTTHYEFTPDRELSILSTISAETVVTVDYNATNE